MKLIPPIYVYRWNRMGRKGQRCIVLCRGKMNSCLIQFEDGFKAVTSRNALRKDTMSTLNEKQFIELTPRGLETPAGIQRVNRALEAAQNMASAFAGAAAQFIEDHQRSLKEMVEIDKTPALSEDWQRLRLLLQDFRNTREEVARAVSGAPEAGHEHLRKNAQE